MKYEDGKSLNTVCDCKKISEENCVLVDVKYTKYPSHTKYTEKQANSFCPKPEVLKVYYKNYNNLMISHYSIQLIIGRKIVLCASKKVSSCYNTYHISCATELLRFAFSDITLIVNPRKTKLIYIKKYKH